MSFLRALGSNIYHALIGAGAWSLVWFLAFFGSTVLMEIFDNTQAAITASALSITAAVMSGHLAKLVSYFIGSDTDFRHLFVKDPRGEKEHRSFFRFFASLLFLILGVFLLYRNINAAVKSETIVGTEFFIYSSSFFWVILSLFAAQLVFSWPDPFPAEAERELENDIATKKDSAA